ncbi:MAG: class I SAM-dependent methyltransferase [Actinomycetota bacterium]|nr:class I SAM-dependent methyltransferase [Actinomycetota bacterium]
MPARDTYRPAPPVVPRAGGRVSRRQLLGLSQTKLGHAPVDLLALTQRRAAEWDGEARVAFLRALEPVAEIVATVAGVGVGTRVLDVGAGDGNVALACAARGARVDACDLSAAMVARGRARCADAVTWREADAQRLPYANDRFDVVVSALGAACAPHPLQAAQELARVCRPGGSVAIAAWVPRGLPGRLPELVDAVDPAPEGVPAPGSWGRSDRMQARLEPRLEQLALRTYVVSLRFESADACFDALAPSTLDDVQRAALRPGFERLLASVNNRPPAVELDARLLVASGLARP